MSATRLHLTIHEKNELRRFHSSNRDVTQHELQDWVALRFAKKIGRSTIGRIISQPYEDVASRDAKNKRKPQHPEMEAELLKFVAAFKDRSAITDSALWEKANACLKDGAKVSYSWVQKFKKRHGIKRASTGDATDANDHAHAARMTADAMTLENERKRLADVFKSYEPCDVFTFGETELLYARRPSHVASESARVTVGLCCNMDGSMKMKPLVVHGTTLSDAARASLRECDSKNLPIRLVCSPEDSKQPRMNSKIFSEWLTDFDLTMRGRNVILLVDDAAEHVGTPLTNVRLCFLAQQLSTSLMPMGASGITRNFKFQYKKRFVTWLLDVDSVHIGDHRAMKRIDLLSSSKLMTDAWEAVTPTTIRSSWCQTGILSEMTIARLKQQNEPRRKNELSDLNALIPHLHLDGPMTADEFVDLETRAAREALQSAEAAADDTASEEEEEEEEEKGDDVANSAVSSDRGDDRIHHPFSHQEALQAAQKLSVYMFSRGLNYKALEPVFDHARSAALKTKRQQTLTRFFRRSDETHCSNNASTDI